VTKRAFSAKSRVCADTLIKRFGSWKLALIAAGYGDRYGGPAVITDKMRAPSRLSDNEIIAELSRVASVRGASELSISDFRESSPLDPSLIRRRFGGWKRALDAAGFAAPRLSRRYSDEERFENLLRVWTHYGRQPTYDEMKRPPSEVGINSYKRRWGTWRKALGAFVKFANDEGTEAQAVATPHAVFPSTRESSLENKLNRVPNPRSIPLVLRYKILVRDRFKCVLCGDSPSTNLNCDLHVDHITPAARGGTSNESNLRVLCKRCNLGKGARVDESID
jgi:hypothetical protein